MENPTKSAFILIDMEQGFIDPASAHCIKGAAATVPACEKAIRIAREKKIPLFFVKRIYRPDGSDVECTRYQSWIGGGRSMAPGSYGAQEPESLSPQNGDYTIIKPRWSAFFQTELDLILRRLGIRTVILAGTTTPNCIRTTCYDANALDYNVVVLSDCTSSQTEEIQQANLADMERMGALILDSNHFALYCENSVPDLAADIRSAIENATTTH
ncbi:MAG: cysteine hydrolase [Oscillospiraceae bacterium]|nr:cysteine hydrolase [Oscillospiraceae bacterium]